MFVGWKRFICALLHSVEFLLNIFTPFQINSIAETIFIRVFFFFCFC